MRASNSFRRNLFVCLAAGAVLGLIGMPSYRPMASPSPPPAPQPTQYISTLPPPGSGHNTRTCFCKANDNGEVLCNQDPSIAWTFGPDPICPADPAACPDHEVDGVTGDACTGYRYSFTSTVGQCGDWTAVAGKIYCLGEVN